MPLFKCINAGPFAALFLILTAVPSIIHVAKGLPLRIASMGPCYPGDRRVVVIRVLPGGQLMINTDSSSWSELGGQLDAIFRTRAERLAFVTAEPDLPFSQVADAINIATKHLDRVALFPRSSVLNRKPFYPGENSICVGMSTTER